MHALNAYSHEAFSAKWSRHLTCSWSDRPSRMRLHDVCYAYRNDHAETWFNGAGQ